MISDLAKLREFSRGAKKILFIMNGDTASADPNTLEGALREKGASIDLLDVRKVRDTKEMLSEYNPDDYNLVVRSIQGGVPGDTDKSLAIQKLYEEKGVRPFLPVETVRKITDKLACRIELQMHAVEMLPAVGVGLSSKQDAQAIKAQVKALGAGPYIVRKNIGSSKDSHIVALHVDEVIKAVEAFRRPTKVGGVPRGSVIHKLPEEPAHFRVVVANRKVFGANACQYEKGHFALNKAQGVTMQPVAVDTLPDGVERLAMQAAMSQNLRVAAVDIVASKGSKPQVLDMNLSPDLAFENSEGLSLHNEVAEGIISLQQESAIQKLPKGRSL